VNEELYGSKLTNKQLLSGGQTAPASAMDLITALNRYSPREAKDTPIETRAVGKDKKK
jgi:lipid-binding SYLF domain-containing protein